MARLAVRLEAPLGFGLMSWECVVEAADEESAVEIAKLAYETTGINECSWEFLRQHVEPIDQVKPDYLVIEKDEDGHDEVVNKRE